MGTLTAVVLAAGQGTRMKSDKPKVLHELCGLPMVHHVVRAAFDAGADDVVAVVGFGADAVTQALRGAFGDRVRTAVQEKQLGTGDAVRAAVPALGGADRVLVLCGDTPLLRSEDLTALAGALGSGSADLGMLTYEEQDPTGYGRVLRKDGRIVGVREHKDCSDEERTIREVNPAVYIAHAEFLKDALGRLTNDNAQGEYYFTDVVEMAAGGAGVVACTAGDPSSLVGINDRSQLARAEAVLYERVADGHRKAGATLRHGVLIEASVEIGRDAIVEHGVVLRGRTSIGAGARVDVGSVLTNVQVAEGAFLKPYTIATDSTVGPGAQIGPFSHLRPASEIGEAAHVGNFVETKKTRLGKGAKANHLAYLGDGDVGEGANVGAGTIFCNYDGFMKHKTEIGKGAFIGSDSQLVAPIRIGDGAYVGTGTTVTKNVPDQALAIGRARQENKEGYAERLRNRLKAAKERAAKEAGTK